MAMPHTVRSPKLSALGLAALLALGLFLAACDGQATPTAPVTGTNSTATSAAASDATATPVVLATRLVSPMAASPTSGNSPGATATSAATSTVATPGPTSASPRTGNSPSALATGPTISLNPTTAPSAGTTKPLEFASLTGYPGKLSILGPDYYIYVQRFDGKPPKLLLGQAGVTVSATQDGELFRFPTWSRDGSKLAAVGLNAKGGKAAGADVFVVSADGTNLYKAQDNETLAPVYLSWSPDGNWLTLLLENTPALELRLVDTSKGAAGVKAGPRKLFEGKPLYTAWAPDSDVLVVHTTANGTDNLGQLKASDSKTGLAALKLNGQIGLFRAPAWSSNGAYLAFSSRPADQFPSTKEVIIMQGKDGLTQGIISGDGPAAAFNWAPDSPRLAYSFQDEQVAGRYKGLNLSDLGGSDAPKNGKISGTKIVKEDILAFFWSPDGKKLAYLTTEGSPVLAAWNLYEVETRTTTFLASFYPSPEFFQVISYFDQYAQSDSVWSPDSKTLVFSGWAGTGLSTSRQTVGTPTIYLVPTEGPKVGRPTLVGPGTLAFWAK